MNTLVLKGTVYRAQTFDFILLQKQSKNYIRCYNSPCRERVCEMALYCRKNANTQKILPVFDYGDWAIGVTLGSNTWESNSLTWLCNCETMNPIEDSLSDRYIQTVLAILNYYELNLGWQLSTVSKIIGDNKIFPCNSYAFIYDSAWGYGALIMSIFLSILKHPWVYKNKITHLDIPKTREDIIKILELVMHPSSRSSIRMARMVDIVLNNYYLIFDDLTIKDVYRVEFNETQTGISSLSISNGKRFIPMDLRDRVYTYFK